MAYIGRSAVSIRFYGFDLDPDVISRVLGSAPTLTARRGDTQKSADGEMRTIKKGSWRLEYGDPDAVTIEEKILFLLGRVTDDLEAWHEVNRSYTGDIFCGLFLDGWNEGFELSPEVIKKLADRHLKISFDVYSPTDSWYADNETDQS